MKINKIAFVAMMMTVALVVLMGCQPAVDPLPDPVKVTIADTFMNIENTSESITGVYYWDDEPGVYYTSGDVALTDQESGSDLFTLTNGSTTYLNQKWLSVGVENDLVRGSEYLTYTAGGFLPAGDYRFIQSGTTIVIQGWYFGTTWQSQPGWNIADCLDAIIINGYTKTGY
jgi:hypothetical protein